MYRWLQRLFSSPARPAAEPASKAAPASVPVPAPVRAQAPVTAPADGGTGAPPVSFDQIERVGSAWNGWLYDPDAARADGLEMNAAETGVLEALQAILSAQQSGAALVRRMPGLIPQLLQSLRNDSFSGSALARTISSDVVLVAAVIRLANSACAGTGNSIGSVEQAVILIGQEGLRQLITTVAFRPIIDVNSGHYMRRLAPRLWEHAERSAMSARALAAADADAGIDPFEAFLAALLQNVGLIVALRLMDQASGGAPQLGSELFLAQLARDTRLLSASIAREWNFPETVVQALAEQGVMRRGVRMMPLGRLLQLTDYLGKLRILSENGVLDDSDASLVASLFAGLPPNARDCYALLAASREQVVPL